MIKALLIGIWVGAVALGSVYGAIMFAKPPVPEEESDKSALYASLQRIDSDVISVPVIADSKVHGYFLTQVSFLIDPKDMDVFPITPQEMLNDTLINLFIGNKIIDFPNMSDFDLEGFRDIIGKSLNERVGREVFHDIIVGRLDYLSKEDIRSNIRQKNFSMDKGVQSVGKK